MAKAKNRARLITKGRQLKDADSRNWIVRNPEENPPVTEPVDFEKLWRRNREDGQWFLEEFLKNVQGVLCKSCLEKFHKAWQDAFYKVHGGKT